MGGRTASGARGWAAPLASGLLLTLAVPPFHLLVPSFLALVPVAVWVARLPAGPDGGRAAVGGGALLGLAHHGTAIFWMVPALSWVSGWVAWPVFATVLVLLVGLTALFAWTLHRGVRELGAPLWIALPVTWTGVEWIQGHLPGGLSFPWLGLGTSLTAIPELVGLAELVGARGVTFWLAAVHGLVAAALLARPGDRRRPAVAAAAVLSVGAAWGIWRAGALETRPALRVAVVQPGIPAQVKLEPHRWEAETLEALDALLPRIPPGSADLVALPEGLLPVDPLAFPRRVERLRGWSAVLEAPLLFGAYGLGPPPAPGADRGEDRPGTRNAAFVMRPAGLDAFRYDKRRLVPLVERDPLPGSSWLERALTAAAGSTEAVPAGAAGVARAPGGLPGGPDRPALGSFVPGGSPSLATVGNTEVGVLVCFEAIFPEAARELRLAGADLLVNVTNDAWFAAGAVTDGGGSPGLAARTALAQHPAHLVMRAIEGRVGVARAANTGISLFVDPTGRVHGVLPGHVAAVGVAEARTTDVLTLYARTGDLVGPASALAALALLLGGSMRGRARCSGVSRGPRGSLDPHAPRV